jgi:riboflavin kinase / FMN adenylyltransferase
MQIVQDFSQAELKSPSLVTVGAYDGMHLGHQHLISQMTHAASAQGNSTVVVTFFPRPQAVLAPHIPTRYLTMPEERAELLAQLDIDVTAILPFTRELAQMPAEEFVHRMVVDLQMRELWVGPDFALGRQRQGDIPALRQMGADMGFRLNVIQPLMHNEYAISSTRIRALIEAGDVQAAAALLGRFPSVRGTVTHGDNRGRTLGFPTANIVPSAEMVVPAQGVYACFAHLDSNPWMAVTNIGSRPTFSNGIENTIEAHLLHFNGDLYGKTLKIDLVDFLRPERRFDSAENLIEQVTHDARMAEEILTRTPYPLEDDSIASADRPQLTAGSPSGSTST